MSSGLQDFLSFHGGAPMISAYGAGWRYRVSRAQSWHRALGPYLGTQGQLMAKFRLEGPIQVCRPASLIWHARSRSWEPLHYGFFSHSYYKCYVFPCKYFLNSLLGNCLINIIPLFFWAQCMFLLKQSNFCEYFFNK